MTKKRLIVCLTLAVALTAALTVTSLASSNNETISISEPALAQEAADSTYVTESSMSVDVETGEITDENGQVIGNVNDGSFSITDSNGEEILVTAEESVSPDGTASYTVTTADSISNAAQDVTSAEETSMTIDSETGEIRNEKGELIGYANENQVFTLEDGDGSPIIVQINPEQDADGTVRYSITSAD